MIISSTALQSTIFQSTMSSLAQQLQNIKHSQRALGVLPNQMQPTLILDRHTATSTSSDLIYTMAVVSYAKLVKQHASIKFEGESIMSSENRDINRNTLNKEVNRQLSQRLIKFLLKISPFFLSEDCQKVIEYLLHNYKINIFQAEALSIIYLQYWNTSIYKKLIQNIPEKIIQMKLPFLVKLNSRESLNITYIVKSISYSHYLMSSLLLYTLEYVRGEGEVNLTMDIEVNLGQELQEKQQKLVRCDPRRFLLQLFTQFMNRKMMACYKYILQFCGKAIASGKIASSQTCSMVMVLSARLFVEESITDQLLRGIIAKLIKNGGRKDGFDYRSLFDFIVIIWQRKPNCINFTTLEFLEKNDSFHSYLMKFKCSLWMVLVHLLQNWIQGRFYINLLKAIGNRVKRDQFYRLYNEQYSGKLFELFQICLLQETQQQVSEIVEFFKQYFLYETATYYNGKKVIIKNLKQKIISMYSKEQLKISKNWQFIFNMSKIQKSFPQQKLIQQKLFIQENQQEEQSEKVQMQVGTAKSSLLTHLQRKDEEIAVIDYKSQSVKQALRLLIEQYYSECEVKISQQQKNQIIQNNIDLYNYERLVSDLRKEDFISPIKYLAQFYDLQSSQKSLELLITKIKLFEDVLYRQLMRLSLNHIAKALNVNYKNIIYFLNTFYKKIISNFTQGETKIQLMRLSEILLKVSEGTIGRVGTKRGKYQKLLHNHGKLIADLIIGIKWKKVVTKQLTNDEKMILDHYLRILKVFGVENLYLFNIGIIEILTRKKIDHSHIRYFINKILLGSIRAGDLDFYELGMSLAKTVVFLSQLGSIIKLPLQTLDVSLTSGIVKNVIVEFFGLVKDKFKRVIIKKLLMFIRNIFQNTYIIESFKAHLVEQSQANLRSLLSLFTQIYKIIGLISSEDGKVIQFKQNIMDKITNIFPLNLRLVLFQPLMPNQHLYRYLADQLAQHVVERSKFVELEKVMNIVPDEVTFEWVKFVRECLRRGYVVGQQLLRGVFAKLDLQLNVTPFAEFVSQIVGYQPESLFEYLPVCIQIFQKHCQKPNDFTLALSAKFIQNLGEMVDPYLNTLIISSLEIENEYTECFISQVTSHLAPSTLIRFVKQNWKSIKNLKNFSLFFKAVVMKGVGESLNKVLLSLMSRTLTECLQEEQNPREILVLQSQIMVQIGLKMNESQLRKTIIDLVRWSENKSDILDQLPFNYRKLAVSQVYCLMAQNLESLFVPFYGYTFQSIIKDFKSINAVFEVKDRQSKSNSLKRKRQAGNQLNETLTQLYLRITLKSLQMLFVGDVQHEFLDSVKIESLGDPLCELILLSQHDAFLGVVGEQLSNCLVALHSCVIDDYQMKNLNYKVLVLLKRKNSRIHRVVFELVDRLMDKLKDRFLMLVGDLAPFLLQWASSREQGIAKTVRKIIGKIEELSGEQIGAYAK